MVKNKNKELIDKMNETKIAMQQKGRRDALISNIVHQLPSSPFSFTHNASVGRSIDRSINDEQQPFVLHQIVVVFLKKKS
jgi:hypothetical protein